MCGGAGGGYIGGVDGGYICVGVGKLCRAVPCCFFFFFLMSCLFGFASLISNRLGWLKSFATN